MLRRRGAGLLVQPNRRRAADEGAGGAPSPPAEPGAPAYIDLPEHEPLAMPLNDEALRKLAEFANRSGTTRTYEAQLKKSADLLREAVGSINDASADRASKVKDDDEKRQQLGRAKPTRAEEDMQKMAARLAEAVGPLTQALERAARETIDRQMALEDAREALARTAQQLADRRDGDRARVRQREQAREQRSQARRAAAAAAAAAAAVKAEDEKEEDAKEEGGGGRRKKRAGRRDDGEGEEADDYADDDDDDDDEEEPAEPPSSAIELLQQNRAARQAEYDRMTAHQKYALNNDYVAFKQMWHDAKYPSGDVPLPDASAWFDASGEPAPYGPDAVPGGRRRGGAAAAAADDAEAHANGGGGGGDGEDSDDDLVVAREVISFNCPLTLVPMKDPYTSRVCKHTFEKDAILEHLSHGAGAGKCPQTGCNRDLRPSDLVPDTVMRRKIERAALQAQRRNMDLDDDDDDDDEGRMAEDMDDQSMIEGPSRTVKRELRRRKEDVV